MSEPICEESENGMSTNETFTVTEQHLKLLRHAYVRWEDCAFGAPAIDCKRPYGNSYVIGDIREILHRDATVGLDEDELARWEKANREHLVRLHRETETVLQIALDTGEFRAGEYVRRNYGRWERRQ